jgi:hypothetical protein
MDVTPYRLFSIDQAEQLLGWRGGRHDSEITLRIMLSRIASSGCDDRLDRQAGLRPGANAGNTFLGEARRARLVKPRPFGEKGLK